MKRSEEILKIMKLKSQAIGMLAIVSEERIERYLGDLQALAAERKEIRDGAKPDQTIAI